MHPIAAMLLRTLERAPVAAVLTDRAGGHVGANLAGASWASVVDRVARAAGSAPAIERALGGASIEHVTVAIATPTGVADVRWTIAPWGDAANPEGLIWYPSPVADGESARAESGQAALLQHILDAIPAPIFFKDEEGRYRGGNRAFAAYIGQPLEKIRGATVYDVAPSDLARIYHEADLELLRRAGEQRYETEVRYADGSRHEVLFTKATFNIDGRAGLVGTILDISERKAAERLASRWALAAQQAETRLRALLDALPVVVLVADDGVVLFSNALAQTLSPQRQAALLRAAPRPSDGLREAHVDESDGEIAAYEIIAVPSPFGGGSARVIVAQEVTARRAVDTRLALTDRLATLGTLAAGIAHEINNPLACISANVEVAIDALSGASEPDRTRINECRAALLDAFVGVSQASTIVRTLRTFAREAPTELGELELASAVESALILAGAELRHRVTVRLDVPQSCRVRADLGRLRQVLVNVLINAAQAMPERPVHENLIHLVAGRSDDRVEITVMDNGRGMPAEVCARAFDPFFSTKPAGEGTGLGLAICRRLMREMGGEIELGSEPGVGSRVVLALPGAAPTSFIQRLGTHAERA